MTAMPPEFASPGAPRASSLPWFNATLVAALVMAFSALLWPQWLHNPDLSHGLFTPLLFPILLRESWIAGPQRFLPAGGALLATIATLLLLGLMALAAGGLYTAALGWSHALVGFTLALALVLLLMAGLLAFASGPQRLLPFNWITFTAVLLWLLSAPIPPGTYSRLTLHLQLWVTHAVLTSLHVLGIAAANNGNIILLPATSVGVEEACSGVRSLVSCVFAGLFFSAALVRRPWSRALIIILAAPLALGMNFLRSLLLTLLANRGVDIRGAWHDATGYAILAVTAVLLGGLALALAHGEVEKKAAIPTSSTSSRSAQPLFASGLALAVCLVVFFAANTHRTPASGKPAPDLAAILPAEAEGWQVQTAPDLYRFSGTLQTQHLFERTYMKSGTDGSPIQLTIYLAWWASGQAPVSLVASHTPDACWPGAGWTAEPTEVPRRSLMIDGRALPPAEFRLFHQRTFPQCVWFWHIYDGRPLVYRDPYSPRELLRLAWRYGFGREGDQLFVRISSNRDWSALENEPLLREICARLQPLGL